MLRSKYRGKRFLFHSAAPAHISCPSASPRNRSSQTSSCVLVLRVSPPDCPSSRALIITEPARTEVPERSTLYRKVWKIKTYALNWSLVSARPFHRWGHPCCISRGSLIFPSQVDVARIPFIRIRAGHHWDRDVHREDIQLLAE